MLVQCGNDPSSTRVCWLGHSQTDDLHEGASGEGFIVIDSVQYSADW